MGQTGNQRGGGSGPGNARRRVAAAAKLDTPLTTEYPAPARVKRQALVAPLTLQLAPPRMSLARSR